MTVREKLEALALSESERLLIRKWMDETPSRPRFALPGAAATSLLYPDRRGVRVSGDGD